MTVYEKHAWVYGFPELIGKPATCYYLETEHSRKWRKSHFVKFFSDIAYNSAILKCQEGDWYSFKFVEEM